MLLKKTKKAEKKATKKENKEYQKENIVVLNSGGFDSVVLMNTLRGCFPDDTIHSIHFHYGARNEAQQQKCVDKVCKKVNAENIVIDLPKFTWTKGEFYNKGYKKETQYVEYRNLVFLSYAISYAESIGAKYIYIALVGGCMYEDDNLQFVRDLEKTISMSGIKIEAPFLDYNKEELVGFALDADLKEDDFFSCDDPKDDGTPCGKCSDCKDIALIKKLMKQEKSKEISNNKS